MFFLDDVTVIIISVSHVSPLPFESRSRSLVLNICGPTLVVFQFCGPPIFSPAGGAGVYGQVARAQTARLREGASDRGVRWTSICRRWVPTMGPQAGRFF